MADYDPTNQRHVSALADALGIGPITWTSEPDPSNRYLTILICRYRDGTEHRMSTVSSSRRDLRAFTAAVSREILAAVIADVPE